LIFRANLAEEVYIIPSPLLAASDIASLSVSDSSSAAILKKIEMVLTKTGQEKMRSFISATSAGNPIALVWQNEAHYIYCANKLNGPGAITVVDGINANEAKRLQRALKS
jgi:glutaminase